MDRVGRFQSKFDQIQEALIVITGTRQDPAGVLLPSVEYVFRGIQEWYFLLAISFWC